MQVVMVRTLVSDFIITKMLTVLHRAGITYSLSPRCQMKIMSSDTYRVLAHTLCLHFPMTLVHCRHAQSILPNSAPLVDQATFFNYVVLNGKQFYASRTIGSNRLVLVHVLLPGK